MCGGYRKLCKEPLAELQQNQDSAPNFGKTEGTTAHIRRMTVFFFLSFFCLQQGHASHRAHCQPSVYFFAGTITLFCLVCLASPGLANVCIPSSSSFSTLAPLRSGWGHCFSPSPINQALASFSQLGKNFYSKHSKPAFHGIQLRLTMVGLVGGDHIQS